MKRRLRPFRFDFYPADWLEGTRGMTPEQDGFYIQVCALMGRAAGPISPDSTWLASACGFKHADPRPVRRLLRELIALGKLRIGEDGLLYNGRMMAEIEKVRRLVENGARGGQGSQVAPTSAEHLPNVGQKLAKHSAKVKAGSRQNQRVSVKPSNPYPLTLTSESETHHRDSPPSTGYGGRARARSTGPAAPLPPKVNGKHRPDLFDGPNGPTVVKIEDHLAKPAGKRRPRHQLPADWHPSESTWAKLQELFPSYDLDAELARMRDWAVANGVVKADWDATFRNWVTKPDAGHCLKGGLAGNGRAPLRHDDRRRQVAELDRQRVEEALSRPPGWEYDLTRAPSRTGRSS